MSIFVIAEHIIDALIATRKAVWLQSKFKGLMGTLLFLRLHIKEGTVAKPHIQQ